MRRWTRIKLGLGLIFGKKYGIIIDTDYATGGSIADFNIKGADIAIRQVGSSENMGMDGAKMRTVLAINNNDIGE